MTLRNNDTVTEEVTFKDNATLYFGSEKDQALSYDADADEVTVTDANGNVATLGGGAGVDVQSYEPQSAAPTAPEVGDVVLADGTNWDPTGAAAATLVAYDTDDTWSAVFTYAGTV